MELYFSIFSERRGHRGTSDYASLSPKKLKYFSFILKEVFSLKNL